MAYQKYPPQLQPYNHPTGIEPLPAAHLITGQAYTMPHLGWGDDVNFYERSEQSYASLQNSLKNYFEKYGRGRFKYQDQVDTEDYFYNPTHMLAQPSNISDQEWDKISLGNFNVTATPKNLNPYLKITKHGSFNVAPNADHNLLLTKHGLLEIDEANQDPTKGYYGDIHEYLHSIDTAGGGGDRTMSDIMAAYQDKTAPTGGWTEQTLYEKWMNDPATEHLNQVSREGFGRFIARAFMDETYKNKHSNDTYKLQPHEIFARAGASTIRTSGKDEGFTKGMFGDLEEGFSNALASFLNN